MRTTTKLAGALAVAAIAATGGTAFTATSTIDDPDRFIGATSQDITGVAVTNVSYTWDSATDATSAVQFTVGAALESGDDLAADLDGTAGECDLNDGSTVTYTCTWDPAVVDADKLTIVVS